ncbi:MAG: CotH kinase family protein [Chlorobiota bacterium]
MKNNIILFFLLFTALNYLSAQVIINEASPDNEESLESSDGEYYDWIELYNRSNQEINLSSLYLSDDNEELDMWRFPNVSILPNEFLIVFCSGRDELYLNELHTNFKLSSDGETVFLTNGITILDSMSFGKVNEDYSYGRLDENSEIKTNLTNPTPTKSNSLSGTIVSSKESGYYLSEFELELTAAEGNTIYYTTNGDVPNEKSNLYSGKIEIKDEYEDYKYLDIPTTPHDSTKCAYTWKPVTEDIPRCRVISFRTKKPDGEWGRTHSKSYFFNNVHDLPVISLVTDNMGLFSQDTGIYVPGVHWDKNDPCSSGNYKQRGREWERAATFSHFNEEELIAEFNAGLRIHGSGSRGSAQKGLRLYARKEYGINKFENKFLPEAEVNEFDNFLIRGTMNDFSHTLMKDAVTMEAVSNLNFIQNYVQPVLLYINGNYWGIHEIRNRFDEDYLSELIDGDKDSIRIVAPVVFGNPWQHQYKEMKEVYDFIVENDLTDDSNYEYVASKYDIPQFIDYLVAETFFANTDWPGNNLIFWKESYEAKYKPLFYDLDAGWRDREKNMIEFALQQEHNDYPNPSSTTVIFNKLMQNEDFQNQFIQRALYLVDNEFTFEKLEPIIEKYTNSYRAELTSNIARWSFPKDEQHWEYKRFYDIYEFARLRNCFYKEHLVEYFNLDPSILCSKTTVCCSEENSTVVYPNPTNDYIQITLDKKPGRLSIMSLDGYEVMSVEDYISGSKIDVSELSSGMYIISANDQIFKFIKINE